MSSITSTMNDQFNAIYKEHDKLIWKIIMDAMRKNQIRVQDMDDLHQKIWMAVWEKGIKEGAIPSLPIIKGIARILISNFVRKDINDNQLGKSNKMTRVGFQKVGPDSDGSISVNSDYEDEASMFYHPDDRMDAVYKLYDSYPEGSKERIFIDWYLSKSDVPKERWTKEFPEGEISKRLGFGGTADGSWQKFRDRMRQEIVKALDTEPIRKKKQAPRGRAVTNKSE